jgi:predicted regulator of Ras-like GTPase activity (Roadblock/LC7/MglB family)
VTAAGPGLDALLEEVAQLEGVLAAAVVETSGGTVLASLRDDDTTDPGVAAAGAADLVLVLAELVARTGVDDLLEDVMVTLTGRYHVVRVLGGASSEPLALVVTFDRGRTNLGLARRELREIGARLDD